MVRKTVKHHIVYLYNMEYPEWVVKWKTKGMHIVREGDFYYLYRVHSE